jgi:DNA primase
MLDDKEILLDILCEILGDPEKVYDSKLQYGYNCPECGLEERKGNLEVSLEKHLFHCWACGDVNGTHGTLGKLIDKYGNKKQKKIYCLLQPEEQKPKEKQKNKLKLLKLPEGFTLFKDSSLVYPIRRQAYNYLIKRGITDNIIDKYGIGFCDKGSFSGRIIIPSYDSKNQLNYFIARSWDPNSRAKYKNPESAKDEIIFFESTINWDEDIYLCEGAFDAIFLPNSIAMLGKHLSELLFTTIYEKAKGDIILALDGDAFDNAVKIYRELNGGSLYGRIKIIKLPKDKDVCDLKGQIDKFYIEIKD